VPRDDDRFRGARSAHGEPGAAAAVYAAVCKSDQRSSQVLSIATRGQQTCDIGRVFQTA
jgi:hypothetical protein